MQPLTLSILPDELAICRLQPDESIPDWAFSGAIWSITRTAEELSIVCAQGAIPDGTVIEGRWRSIKVEGPLDFSLTGILTGLTAPLAAAGVSIFAISTFDTDYLLVKQDMLPTAIDVLTGEGHEIGNS